MNGQEFIAVASRAAVTPSPLRSPNTIAFWFDDGTEREVDSLEC
jgi:hypothetical protein